MKDYLQKIYDEGKDVFGHPQEYNGLKIYPIKLKDVKYQKLFYEIFTHPKNYIPNKEILKSSYLKFAIYVLQGNTNPDGNDIYDGIIDFVSYITKEKVSIEFAHTNLEGLASIKLQIRIGDSVFSEEEFDNIREIFLEQNGLSIDYIEEYNPELEENLAFMNRKSEGIEFQDEIFTFCVVMKIGLKDIEEYSLYQFKNLWEKLIVLKEYDLYKPLIASGQVEIKGGKEVKHYLYRSVKTGRYDSIKMDVEDFMENSDVIKASKPM